MTKSITIDGPAGQLEALWTQTPAQQDNSSSSENATTATANARCALLCHPHPQYGGSMHDGVLAIAADVLSANGIDHLRFNFRGVGASEGQFDNGQGESDDICAAWQWLMSQSPAAASSQVPAQKSRWDSMLLIGYSFGAATAWAARSRCPELQQLVLIAPPTQAMPFTGTAAGNATTRVIVGDQDTYCDLTTLPDGASTDLIAGADHFFSSATDQLGNAISAAL